MANSNNEDPNSSPSDSKESAADQSFVNKFVSGLINSTPLSKWFGGEKRREDGPLATQPPAKRVKGEGANGEKTAFPEPLPGPSGLKSRKLFEKSDSEVGRKLLQKSKRVLEKTTIDRKVIEKNVSESSAVDRESDSGDSTSGYSSAPKIQEVSDRSLFRPESYSRTLFSSLATRRPCFNSSSVNSSTFNSLDFVDRTLSTKRVLNSPFYSGSTTYGGASAYPRRHNQPNISSVQIQPPKSKLSEMATLSKTARRILNTLEQYSTPISDAKRIPVSRKGILSASVGAAPYLVKRKAPVKELQVPTVPDLLQMKQKERLQNSTETVRQLAKKSKSELNKEEYKLREEDSKKQHTNKIKNSLTSKRKQINTEPVREVVLPNVSLPITNLPKFDFVLIPDKTKNEEKKKSNGFTFSEPLIIAKNMKINAINCFKFSEPLSKKPKKVKNNGENIKSTNENFAEKFKLPDSWECSTCLIRNKNTLDKCEACETPKVSFLPKKEDKQWECPTCWIKNKNDSTKCAACETAKPGGSKGFGDNFKQKSDEWECSSCLVRNKSGSNVCVCCGVRKEGEKIEIVEEKRPVCGFSFGIPPGPSRIEIPPSKKVEPTPEKVEPTYAEKVSILETKALSVNPLLKPDEKLPEKTTAAPSDFKFGIIAQEKKDSEKVPIFQFATPSVNGEATDKPKLQFGFGASKPAEKPADVTNKPMFTFGIPSKPTDALAKPAKPTATADTTTNPIVASATKPTNTTSQPTFSFSPPNKQTDLAPPLRKPAEPIPSLSKPAEPIPPLNKPAEPILPLSKPAEPILPPSKPAEPIVSLSKPTDSITVVNKPAITTTPIANFQFVATSKPTDSPFSLTNTKPTVSPFASANKPPDVGTPKTPVFSFGSNQSTDSPFKPAPFTDSFSSKPALPFGTPSTPFGVSQPVTSPFGASKPTESPFGGSKPALNHPADSPFANKQVVSQSTNSPFANKSAVVTFGGSKPVVSQAVDSLFGSKPAEMPKPTFGAMEAKESPFGSKPETGLFQASAGFSFGAKQPETSFGTKQPESAFGASPSQVFKFGSNAPKAEPPLSNGFGTPKPFAFSATDPKPPPSTGFTFGGGETDPKPAGFPFGGGEKPSQAPVFSFGTPTTTAPSTGFSFAPSSDYGLVFGETNNSTFGTGPKNGGFSFGSGAQKPAFNFGAQQNPAPTPQVGFGAVPATNFGFVPPPATPPSFSFNGAPPSFSFADGNTPQTQQPARKIKRALRRTQR